MEIWSRCFRIGILPSFLEKSLQAFLRYHVLTVHPEALSVIWQSLFVVRSSSVPWPGKRASYESLLPVSNGKSDPDEDPVLQLNAEILSLAFESSINHF